MALIGYGRVSKLEQNPDLQINKLKERGCTQIFIDKMSGSGEKFGERPELAKALAYLREGDNLVVWKLDRLGRSLKHLIETVSTLNERHIEFVSLTEGFDTSTPGGKLIFHIMGGLAEFERDLIRERTRAGLEAARARGRQGGRPEITARNNKVRMVKELSKNPQVSIRDICQELKISRTTYYRYKGK